MHVHLRSFYLRTGNVRGSAGSAAGFSEQAPHLLCTAGDSVQVGWQATLHHLADDGGGDRDFGDHADLIAQDAGSLLPARLAGLRLYHPLPSELLHPASGPAPVSSCPACWLACNHMHIKALARLRT